MTRTDLSCLLFFVLAACSVLGQAKQKKLLTPADYKLWSNLNVLDISNQGEWVSYGLRYQSDNDTLFVKSSDGKRSYFYPQGSKGKFCHEKWFATILDNDKLKLTNLVNGTHLLFEGIDEYEFSGNGKFLFMLSKDTKGIRKIIVSDLNNGNTFHIENATCWRFNQDKNKLGYCLQNGEAVIVAIGATVEPVNSLKFQEAIGTIILWQDNDASILFVTQPIDSSGRRNVHNTNLALFRFGSDVLLKLNPKQVPGFSEDRHIEGGDIGTLKISDDGKRIFFSEVKDVVINPYKNPLVEVWHGDDKLLYSERQQFDPLDAWVKTAVWYPDTNEVFEFMLNETHVKLSGDQQYALTSSIEPCELQFKYSPDRDYYITNLTTKERKLWLHCHSPELSHTLMSPTGKYIVYYKDTNWYVYTIESGQHKCLTEGLGTVFYDEANDIGDEPDAYGFGGWTANDKAIIIHDRYDVWKIYTDGAKAERLTKGREKNIIFRLTKTKEPREIFNGVYQGDVIDLNAPLVLKALSPDEAMQGYYIWKKGKEMPLEFSAHRIYDLKKATASGSYIWIKESYDHPPILQLSNHAKTNAIFRSNPQHDKYFWGKVTTIHYVGATGAALTGLLYSPTNYEKGGKYPMIVHVYQKQSQDLHKYENPSAHIFDGFSIINFVNKGYFVLLPDIDYVMNSPADSAVFCTESAVNVALSRGDIDSKRVGLIGHSFGGFETAYIVTKSNLFAAAVAGAAFTDLVSEYLTVSENYKKAEIWRYEFSTNRIIKPLFDNFEGYLHNSSVYNAPNIQTPLLLWTGKEDGHIASTQSTELYLAMRRLNKKVTMLRYPNEDHSLENPLCQEDLQSKVLEWFDYYLKDCKKKEWMDAN